MGKLIKVRSTPGARLPKKTDFSSHTGDIAVEIKKSEDGGVEIWHIYAATPTASNFNDAPVGSRLFDTDDWSSEQVHVTATTWQTVTIS